MHHMCLLAVLGFYRIVVGYSTAARVRVILTSLRHHARASNAVTPTMAVRYPSGFI